MAYYRPRKPPEQPIPTEQPPDTTGMPNFPGPRDIWDTMKAPLTGLWQGLAPRFLGGKNLNFEQYVREQARKRRGFVPQRRAADSWLARVIK